MPLLLTTPINGSPRVKINGFQLDFGKPPRIVVRYDIGDMVEMLDPEGNPTGEFYWRPGPNVPTSQLVLMNDDYDTMIAEVTTVEEGHAIYAGVKRVLYQYLIDKGYFAGTVE